MTTDEHAEWGELAAGHALGALEPEDEHAFLAHLRGCDRCARELRALRDVTGQLAYAADPAVPPPDLGRRILDAAAAERPAVFAREPANIRVLRTRRPTLTEVLGAAAALLILAVASWNLVLRTDSVAKRDAIARRDAALRCLAADGTTTYRMSAGGSERATTCLDGSSAYVLVERLDPTPPTSAYVLWWVGRDGTPHAVERFAVSGSRTAVLAIPMPVRPSDVTAMAVSLEPGRGGDLPATPTRQILSGGATS